MHRLVLLALAFLPSFATPSVAADCSGEIRKVLTRSVNSGPYRTEAVITGDGDDRVILGEDVPPDAIHRWTGPEYHMIVIGSQGWSDTGDGFEAMDSMIAEMTLKAIDPSHEDLLATITDPKCLGTQQLGGEEFLVYEYTSGGDTYTSVSTLRADPKLRLPVTIETRTVIDGNESLTITSYEYDETITIEPPA